MKVANSSKKGKGSKYTPGGRPGEDRESTSVRRFEDGPPSQFECSISCDLMSDPVICSDGFTYDRQSIELWLSTHDTSPMTNTVLNSKALVPNVLLKELIDEYKTNLKYT